jgi:hypothetical protein
MSKHDDEDDGVGYGRPPKKSRFKPGQSGNLRGRRKGSTNFATDLARALKAPVVIHDRGKARKVTTQAALCMRVREKALNGDARAMALLIHLAQTSSDPNADIGSVDSATDQAMLRDYLKNVLDRQVATSPGDTNSRVSPGSLE